MPATTYTPKTYYFITGGEYTPESMHEEIRYLELKTCLSEEEIQRWLLLKQLKEQHVKTVKNS